MYGEWISVKDRKPNKEEIKKNDGTFLVQHSIFGKFDSIMICSYSDNLYKMDKDDFRDKKNEENKDGFYDLDSEYGYYEIDNVDGIIIHLPPALTIDLEFFFDRIEPGNTSISSVR